MRNETLWKEVSTRPWVLPSSETIWMEASVLPEETVWKELSIRLCLHFGTMSSSPSVCRACFEATMAYKRGGAYFDCIDLMYAIVPLKTTRAKGWHRQLSPITGRWWWRRSLPSTSEQEGTRSGERGLDGPKLEMRRQWESEVAATVDRDRWRNRRLCCPLIARRNMIYDAI